MDWIIIIVGVILSLAGIVGSLLPVIPGPPLNYLALLLIHYSDVHKFSYKFLFGWLVIIIAVVILDYLVPIWGAKYAGGGRKGVWGAAIGLVLGIFILPPLGLLLWPFVGAVIGEIVDGKSLDASIRAGTGTFIGFLAGTLAKLIVSIILLVIFIIAII